MNTKNINKKITYEEFLNLCDEDTLAEWVDGEIEYYSPASIRHQRIRDWLIKVIGTYVEIKGLGEVISQPFQMRLREIKHGREPDILFISNKNLINLNETYLDGPADLVIEIISEESRMRDKKIKFEEYQEAGIKEYWLIDLYDKIVNFYILQRDRYKRIEPKEGIYHSKIIKGFWLKADWLFKEPLPLSLKVIGEIIGVDKKLLETFKSYIL